eukprot:CAMPEP_0197415376 /NCGR_PEP_ID=MMETSP1170-20131217/1927_1 /TAXON_ID=54406 /ORGANISM="Sarcinochrysis sp, Strain CCMP770" /LENGTH=86 /DNA_ID=CAMNT_0042942173 /DNA_START=32 /DNA_END=292 /DNA_ORIENTATION=-
MKAAPAPKYEVIDPSPSVMTVIRHWTVGDYAFLVAATGASWLYGYVTGGKVLRVPTAHTCCIIGNWGAILYIYQRTSFILAGDIPP